MDEGVREIPYRLRVARTKQSWPENEYIHFIHWQDEDSVRLRMHRCSIGTLPLGPGGTRMAPRAGSSHLVYLDEEAGPESADVTVAATHLAGGEGEEEEREKLQAQQAQAEAEEQAELEQAAFLGAGIT